ncbi:MAG: DUF5009 domain-containing protein [Syntrophobacter sp.]
MNSVPAKRLLSLDAFRGLTMAVMILVNNPGTYRAVYSQLRHAPWNGWTFADTIFPAFLYIMGVSTAFSLAGRKEKGIPDSTLELRIVERTVILFLLGLFLNSYPIFHLSSLRIPGVLQRIALCYLFTCQIMLTSAIRGRIAWLLGLLLSYWAAMRFFPVPEIGAGMLEPGANFAAWVDSLFLSGHMWSHYETWDPEGIVGTIPAIASTLLGVLTGDWLRSRHSDGRKTLGMLFLGMILLVSGMILNQWLPINKNIWSSTFAIFMAGLSMIGLGLFYWVIDVKGYKRWTHFFVVFGMNSLAMFFLSEVLDVTFRFIRVILPDGSDISLRAYLFRSYFEPHATLENASLLFAISFVLFMYLFAWVLWKKKWFIKI